MKFDVVCFGSGVIDNFVQTDMPEVKGNISYPAGSKILIKGLKVDVGGGGTNTAVAFARLGLKTGCICGIGDDLNGQLILDLLKKEKVKFLGRVKDGNTGTSIILDSKNNNRTILTYKGVNNEINFRDIKRFKTKYIYFTSLLGESFKTQLSLARKMKGRGVRIAFNPSDYLIKNKNLKEFLKVIDILILNKEEALMLTKEKDYLRGLNNLGPGVVVVTDKNNMIKCYDGSKKYFIKPHDVKVVERTGAGDAFSSGFVAGQIVGKSINDSLKLGLLESESVIKYFGAKNKLIRRKVR